MKYSILIATLASIWIIVGGFGCEDANSAGDKDSLDPRKQLVSAETVCDFGSDIITVQQKYAVTMTNKNLKTNVKYLIDVDIGSDSQSPAGNVKDKGIMLIDVKPLEVGQGTISVFETKLKKGILQKNLKAQCGFEVVDDEDDVADTEIEDNGGDTETANNGGGDTETANNGGGDTGYEDDPLTCKVLPAFVRGPRCDLCPRGRLTKPDGQIPRLSGSTISCQEIQCDGDAQRIPPDACPLWQQQAAYHCGCTGPAAPEPVNTNPVCRICGSSGVPQANLDLVVETTLLSYMTCGEIDQAGRDQFLPPGTCDIFKKDAAACCIQP